ncbi:uncharacterized protein L201_007340 [Kwoniella dendrophila CBS 6074]|uniref:DM2 domain-containing protein n=1 Tax=Kwoniella dendrophila CBS 6074 TaxID=1295534 RepID=A0AAX4K6J1_9TREE
MVPLYQYVQSLLPRIRGLLEGSDLSTVSAKGIRKQLVAQGEDAATIKAAREMIDEEIGTIYDQLTSAVPPSPPSSPDVALQPKAEPGSSQPQPLHYSVNVKREVKPSIAIREDEDESDAQMARRLQSEFDDQASSSRPRRANATSTPAKKKKKPVKKRISRADAGSDEEGGEVKKKRKVDPNPNNPFNREMILSDALADLVSAPRLSRPQVVKQIWAYVKDHGYQDQSDKRYILCDDKLKKVFHTDRLHMFTMNKILVDHLRNPDNVIFKEESKNGVKTEPAQRAPVPNNAPIQMSQEIIDDESDDDNY